MDIKSKADHVRAAVQMRRHACHWPGCDKQVPPAMWGCRTHWYALPQTIRNEIWREYRIGQEEDMRPSRDYISAARKALDWIALMYNPPQEKIVHPANVVQVAQKPDTL